MKEIDVDLRPGSVLTNLNQQQAGTWVPLSSVSQNIQLRTLDGSTGLRQYPFDLTSYLSPDKEAYVEQYMGILPVNYSRKAVFGGIRYENLGTSVLNATILVPVTVRYEFGSVTTMMKIVLGNGGITEPVTTKCEKPSISYRNGELVFSSATEGAEYVYDITDEDIKQGYTDKVQLTATYNISVYATKAGYDNSETATATLCWIDKEPTTEGITDGVAQIPSKAVLIQSEGGILKVEGIDDGTQVAVYTLDGKQAGSAVSRNGAALVGTSIQPGNTAIVKIGERAVKLLIK